VAWAEAYEVNQPCIPPGSLNRVPASAGGKGWNVIYAGWHVTLCYPIWRVNFCSGMTTSVSELLYPCYVFTYLLTYLHAKFHLDPCNRLTTINNSMSIVTKRLDGSRCYLVTRYGGRPWPRRRCVRWGFSPPERGTAPQFSAHVYCGQTAGRMKTPLGTEVNLGPGHSVFDGDRAAAPAKGA